MFTFSLFVNCWTAWLAFAVKDSQQAPGLEESRNEVSQKTKPARFDEVTLGMYMWCLLNKRSVGWSSVCLVSLFGKTLVIYLKANQRLEFYLVFVVWMLRDAYAVTVSETALEEDSIQLLQLNKSTLVHAVSSGHELTMGICFVFYTFSKKL